MIGKNTLVVNLFAGPGSGKSTTMAGTFHRLKLRGVNAEFAHEFAKDLTWEERKTALSVQPYVFGKQLMKIVRVHGSVDVVITDSPLLLSRIYARKMPPSWYDFVLWQHRQFRNLNVFIDRVKDYEQAGRSQTFDEAKEIDDDIIKMLDTNDIPFWRVKGDMSASEMITNLIMEEITP